MRSRPGLHLRLRLAMIIVAACCAVGASRAQPAAPPPPPTGSSSAAAREAERELLKEQIRKYSAMVQAMRDSLADREHSAARTRELEATVLEMSEAVGAITEQLAELEVEVVDNRVSLRDGRGGQVTVEIPEDLPEQLSAGLSSITRMFLEELPDTVHIGDQETGFTWSSGPEGFRVMPVQPRQERRMIDGGLVKIRDDMVVAANEDVLGDAVAVLGDAQVSGRIRGDLVVVLGDLQLADTAQVDGQVITILGRLERDPGARLGSVTVIDPGQGVVPRDLSDLTSGWASFVLFQGLFLGVVLLALLLLALVPRARVEALVETANRRPGPCLGVGLLVFLIGHAASIGLSVILVLTVIGIPVALLALLGLVLLDLAAVVTGGLLVGRLVCRRLGSGCPNPWREMLVGLALIHLPAFLGSLLGAVGAPLGMVALFSSLGGLFKLGAFLVGLGALALSRFGGQPARPQLPPPGLATAIHE